MDTLACNALKNGDPEPPVLEGLS
jgi:hypothetical protein